MTREDLKAGDVLCRQGEAGTCMYLIGSGKLDVVKEPEGRAAVSMATHRAGEVAGVTSLFDDAVRSATLMAREPGVVWSLDRETLHRLLGERPQIASALLRQLSQQLRRETTVAARLLSQDADAGLKVAVFDSKPYTEKALRAAAGDELALHFFGPRLGPDTASLASGFQVVCAFVNDTLSAEVLEQLADHGVKMIALRCAGYNNLDVEAARQEQITVARVPAYSPYAVAEHATALALALNRQTHRAYNRVREGNFSLNGLVGFDFHGRTAGIVGVGKIGQCLVRILRGFGMELLGYDKYPDEAFAEETGLRYVALDELLRESDLISLHAPLMPATYHMIDGEAIATMKEGVMLINTSRGALVDTAALIEGLKSGRIGAAGLDVYEEEAAYFFEDRSDEVITDDLLARLMTFNNVLVTSHQAFLTEEALANIAETTMANIGEFREGKRFGELTYAVVPETDD